MPVTVAGDDAEAALVTLHPDWAARGALPPASQCTLPCVLRMEPGPYRLDVVESPGTVGGSNHVIITGPSKVLVTPRDQGTRTLGLALGIGGIAAAATGIWFIADGLRSECRGDICYSNTGEAAAGFTVFLAGTALTSIGWFIYGKSLRPGVDVEHAAATPRARVGVVPLRGGAGLGGSLVL